MRANVSVVAVLAAVLCGPSCRVAVPDPAVRVYRAVLPDGSHTTILVNQFARRLIRQGTPWRRDDAAVVVVRVLDGPTPRTIWARPAWSLAGIPGRSRYLTFLAKYRANGDTEDGDASNLPGVRIPPSVAGVRRVTVRLSVGSGVDSHVTLPLDVSVQPDGTASIALAQPRHPFQGR
jgi:hypothetical protein